MTAILYSLHTYPVKSCGALQHDSVHIGPAGLWRDRHWIIVSAQGQMLTQRTYPQMARIQPSFAGQDLVLHIPGEDSVIIPWESSARTHGTPAHPVTVWSSQTLGADEGDEAAHALSRFMQMECRLLRVHARAERYADTQRVASWRTQHKTLAPDMAPHHPVGFADGFPFLVTFEASLNELNDTIQHTGHPAVPMDRFRPNLVVQGTEPFEEDFMAGLQIGGVTLAFVKPCTRCNLPNVDQRTGETGPEPGRTLHAMRLFTEGTLFGCNAVATGMDQNAILHTGSQVQVLYA